MTYDELVKQLTADLQKAGQKNIDPPSGMSDAEARDWSMANVAAAIAKAIRDGLVFDIKGSATVAELNAIPIDKRVDGDIWAVKDSGFLLSPQGEPLAVTAGDLVMWAGDTWSRIFHLDLTGYATVDQLNVAVESMIRAVDYAVSVEREARSAADSALRKSIEREVTDRENADGEIITSLEDETTARRVNDELLQQQIEEVAVQTDWEEEDPGSLAYLKNKPLEMTDEEINNLIDSLGGI